VTGTEPTGTEPRGAEQHSGPIAAATASLLEWLAATAEVEVRTATPRAPVEDGLSVWPLALLPERELRNATKREPLRLRVRHLLTGDVDALDRVLAAAVAAGSPSIHLDPPSDQAWLALGAAPRPALLIDMPARVARPTPTVPLVRSPLRVDTAPPVAARGRVEASGGIAMAGVRVEVVSTGAWTYTDRAGRFAFAAVPEESPVRLAVQGRGRRLVAEITPDQDLSDLVIQLNFEED